MSARRRLTAVEELYREMQRQYANGQDILRHDAAARRLFEDLKAECPHVPEELIVRAFATPVIGTKHVEAATIAVVRRKEHNALLALRRAGSRPAAVHVRSRLAEHAARLEEGALLTR